MRHPDWLRRLDAVIARHAMLPFAWGRSDCLMLVADADEALSGRVIERPDYADARGAQAALEAMGANSPHDVLAQRYEEIAPALAYVGDIAAVIDERGRRAGAICLGARLCVKGEFGVAVLPRSAMLRAFRI